MPPSSRRPSRYMSHLLSPPSCLPITPKRKPTLKPWESISLQDFQEFPEHTIAFGGPSEKLPGSFRLFAWKKTTQHDMVMPGFRPTEEELAEFYLHRKVEGKRFNVELSTFLNLYRSDPWELPGTHYIVTMFQDIGSTRMVMG